MSGWSAIVNPKHLRNLREAELELVKPYFFRGARVLEIGAGEGWQAKLLEEIGLAVEAIDIPGNPFVGSEVRPVALYDGYRIPFDDASFDIVFSSNVLEHIPHLNEFESEIRRVLKANGFAIHLVPSGVWRFWTNLTHYPFILKQILSIAGRFFGILRRYGCGNVQDSCGKVRKGLIRKVLFPTRHGERGSLLGEVALFSGSAWSSHFIGTDWVIRHRGGNGLFYTGYSLFGALLSLNRRRALARLLGSACHVFWVEPTGSARSQSSDNGRREAAG